MKVKFMYNREEKDLFAYFPESIYKSKFFGTMYECYAQGEHSVCDKGYIQDSMEVGEDMYGELLKELRGKYDRLEII